MHPRTFLPVVKASEFFLMTIFSNSWWSLFTNFTNSLWHGCVLHGEMEPSAGW